MYMANASTSFYPRYNTSTSEVTYVSSSERFKSDITAVATSVALDRIKALRPVEFYWKEGTSMTLNDMGYFEKQRGFIAEEVAVIDHTFAGWGWFDEDGYNPLTKSDAHEFDNEIEEIPDEDVFDLDEAVPMNWNIESVIADLVGAVQELESRLAALEA